MDSSTGAQKMSNAERTITRIIGRDSLPMTVIVGSFPQTYRNDYRETIAQMVEKGLLVRTWNDYGIPFYTVAR